MNQERRNDPRKHVTAPVVATNVLTGEPAGRVGDLSHNGLLLIAAQPLNYGALYQLRFALPGNGGSIDAGVHVMWTQAAATPGQHWAGLRIISIAPDAAAALDAWLAGAD